MTGPWLFFVGSPLKVALWLGNRLLTATGLLLVWQRLKHAPDRGRRFLGWFVAINAVSWLVLVGVLWFVASR